jgi:phosphoglycolate phosphatase
VKRDAGDGPAGFDLDLTLINSRPAIMAAWEAVAAEMGAQIDLAQVDTRMGVKLEEEVAYWFGPDEQTAAAECYRRHYVRLAPDMTTLLPGAAEAVEAVRRAGERVVVVTAKHATSVGPSLTAAGLTPDEVFTHVHGPQKAEVLVQVGAALYVGDTPHDMSAARTAAVAAVGVTTGSFGQAELTAAGADVVLDSLVDFPDWYAGFRDGHPHNRAREGTSRGT